MLLWLKPSAALAFGAIVTDEMGLGARDAAMGMAYTAAADDFTAAYYNPAALTSSAESPVVEPSPFEVRIESIERALESLPRPQRNFILDEVGRSGVSIFDDAKLTREIKKALELLQTSGQLTDDQRVEVAGELAEDLGSPHFSQNDPCRNLSSACIQLATGAKELGRFFAGPRESHSPQQTYTVLGATFRPGYKGSFRRLPVLGLGTMIFSPDVRRPASDGDAVSIRSNSFGTLPTYVGFASRLPIVGPHLSAGAGLAVYAFAPNSRSLVGLGGSAIQPQVQTLALSNPLKITAAPDFGILYEYGDLKAGLVYRGGADSRATVHLMATSSGGLSGPPTVPPPTQLPIIVTWIPQEVAAGVAYKGFPDWELSADLVFKKWDEFISATGNHPSMGFHNRLVPRIGLEHRYERPSECTVWLSALRAGYYFEPTPVPQQTGMTNFIDSDQHVFSLGAAMSSVYGDIPLKAELFCQLHWLTSRTTHKSNASDPLFPGYEVSGSMLNAGVIVTFYLRPV